MSCYNISRIQPSRLSIDDLCVWKPARHTDLVTGENTRCFELCIDCSGYEKVKDCYFSHKMMDNYLVDGHTRQV